MTLIALHAYNICYTAVLIKSSNEIYVPIQKQKPVKKLSYSTCGMSSVVQLVDAVV